MQTILRTTFLALLLAPAAAAGEIVGHVRDSNGQGLQGVDLDVFDAVTGAKLVTPNDNTGVGGSFAVVVPNGLYRVTFDPTVVPGFQFAPAQILNVAVNGTTQLGNVVLQPGIVVSGRVQGPGGAAVAGADLDLIDSSNGTKAFTPGDNTDPQGNFSFWAPKGTYFAQAQPPVASKLLSKKAGPFPLQGNTNIGTIALGAGALLSGGVTGGGLALAGVNLDVLDLGTGLPVPLLGDLTDATGHYQMVVPLSNLQVAFVPPFGSSFAPKVVSGFLVGGDAVLDATLSPSATDPFPTPLALGSTFAGTFLVPGEVDEIRFDALAGTQLSLAGRAKVKGGARPLFELAGPSLAPVPLPVKSTAASNTAVATLPETGAYRLRCFPGAGSPGAYEVRTKAKIPLSVAKPAGSGSIAGPGAVVEIPFDALAGAFLTGSVKKAAGSLLAPELIELRTPSGGALSLDGVLVAKPTGPALLAPGALLPETGTYLLRVGGAAASTGAFVTKLALKLPKGSPAPPVPEN